MRDYVDARFSIGEVLIPVMFAVIVLTFIPSYEVQTIGIFALWAFFLVSVVDVIILGVILRRKLAAKFGADKVEGVAGTPRCAPCSCAPCACRSRRSSAASTRPDRDGGRRMPRGGALPAARSVAGERASRMSGTRVSSSVSEPCWPTMSSPRRSGSRRS